MRQNSHERKTRNQKNRLSVLAWARVYLSRKDLQQRRSDTPSQIMIRPAEGKAQYIFWKRERIKNERQFGYRQ